MLSDGAKLWLGAWAFAASLRVTFPRACWRAQVGRHCLEFTGEIITTWTSLTAPAIFPAMTQALHPWRRLGAGLGGEASRAAGTVAAVHDRG
jgi:hypothetical protein